MVERQTEVVGQVISRWGHSYRQKAHEEGKRYADIRDENLNARTTTRSKNKTLQYEVREGLILLIQHEEDRIAQGFSYGMLTL